MSPKYNVISGDAANAEDTAAKTNTTATTSTRPTGRMGVARRMASEAFAQQLPRDGALRCEINTRQSYGHIRFT
ncbi:MAG: hypothetical protein ACLPV4_04475 [Solirubrobacteraceae bacterium]